MRLSSSKCFTLPYSIYWTFTAGAGGQRFANSSINCELGNSRQPYPAQPKLVKQCYHARLFAIDTRSTQWFSIEDEDFKALFKIITGTKFSNDIKKCCKFIHTGKLESFYSLKLQYLPKSTGFGMTTTIILTMLAAIQNNVYLESSSKLKTYSVKQWSRANKEHVLKNRNIYDYVTFKKTILNDTIKNLKDGKIINADLSSYIRTAVPKTFHGKTAPSKEVLLEKQKSRMEWNNEEQEWTNFLYHELWSVINNSGAIRITFTII